MSLSIIFVNWNSQAYLKACLVSLYKYDSNVEFEVIVVDNNSPEKGVSALREEFPQIKIFESDKNLGFAGANNVGFELSTGSNLLFLNPDTELTGNALQPMLRQLEKLPDVGILGCKLLNTDGTIQTSCIQKFPTILNQVLDIEALRLKWPSCPLWDISPLFANNPGAVKVEAISGAAMFVKREVFTRIGKFSEDYFMYAEDIDLCYKAQKLGLNNYYFGNVAIVHHGGKSSGQVKVNQWATSMKLRAVQKLLIKRGGTIYGFAYRLGIGIAAAVRLVLIAGMQIARKLVHGSGNLQLAWQKWLAIFRWAIYSDGQAFETKSKV